MKPSPPEQRSYTGETSAGAGLVAAMLRGTLFCSLAPDCQNTFPLELQLLHKDLLLLTLFSQPYTSTVAGYSPKNGCWSLWWICCFLQPCLCLQGKNRESLSDSRQIAQEKGFPQILSHIEGQRGCAIIGNDCKLFKHKRDYNLKTSWSTIPPLYKDILAMPLVTALSR